MHPCAVHVGCSRELVCPVIDCHAGDAAAADILLTPPPKKSIDAQPPPVKITRRAAAEILTSAQGSMWNTD